MNRPFRLSMIANTVMVLFSLSCTKNDNTPTPPPPFPTGYTVYMVGTNGNNAVYWKNGKETNLQDGYLAKCITISGQDIYIGGQLYPNPTQQLPVLWKNDQPQNLSTTGFYNVNGIALSGNDVYAVGIMANGGNTKAVIWKNGVQSLLSSTKSAANSIAISGPNVWVCGRLSGNSDTAAIWKDGVLQPNYFTGTYCMANSISTTLSGIYAAGYSSAQAITFSNNQWSGVPSDTSLASTGAMSVTIDGSDVYVGGYVQDHNGHQHAVYWKNGTRIDLTSSYSSATVNGIAVVGTDLYAVGSVYAKDSGYVPVYWKNGQQVSLAKTGTVYGIAVMK